MTGNILGDTIIEGTGLNIAKFGFSEIDFSASPTTCDNFNNGMVSVSIDEGFSPFLYDWSTGANTPNITNLDTGLYHLTVTDSLGCVSSDSVRVVLREPP